MIKTSALTADPVDYSSPAVPIAIVFAAGHADVEELTGCLSGRIKLTERVADAGMVLAYQVEHPDRGEAAHELLRSAGAPAGLVGQIKDRVSGEPTAATGHAKQLEDWAWDMITAPGGMADRIPELAVPVGGPEDGERTPDQRRADMRRTDLLLGAIWGVGMLAHLPGQATTDLLDEVVRLRAALAATSKHNNALAVAA